MSKLLDIDRKVLLYLSKSPTPNKEYLVNNISSIAKLCSNSLVVTDDGKTFILTIRGARIINNEHLIRYRKIFLFVLCNILVPIVVTIITTIVISAL